MTGDGHGHGAQARGAAGGRLVRRSVAMAGRRPRRAPRRFAGTSVPFAFARGGGSARWMTRLWKLQPTPTPSSTPNAFFDGVASDLWSALVSQVIGQKISGARTGTS